MYSSTGWLSNASANRIKHSYLNGFLDVSASPIFREDVDLSFVKVSGNVDLSSGNKVGIGTDNPSGQLEIYEPIGSNSSSTAGTLVIRHGDNAGHSSIIFPSAYKRGSDYGYITYQDDRVNDPNYERSLLVIGRELGAYDNINILTPGLLGIGTNQPQRGKVQVEGYYWYFLGGTTAYWNVDGNTDHASANRPLGVFCHQHVLCTTFYSHSDRRIKNNISEVPDNLSLQIIRELPVKYYYHIDKVSYGEHRSIGFIAQEVKELLPNAVNTFQNRIPDEYRILEDFTWEETTDNKFKLRCDLQDCSGITYSFNVSDNMDVDMIEICVTGNEDNSFTFEKKYSYIFLYGKVVDDFLSLDESQIYAVGISALQEIDREQQADKARIAILETKNNTLKTKMADLLARITALELA